MNSSITNDHFFFTKVNLSSPKWSELMPMEVEDNHADANNFKKMCDRICRKIYRNQFDSTKNTLVSTQNITKKRGLPLIFAKRFESK
jgi:Cu2+-containing amine oxidase